MEKIEVSSCTHTFESHGIFRGSGITPRNVTILFVRKEIQEKCSYDLIGKAGGDGDYSLEFLKLG